MAGWRQLKRWRLLLTVAGALIALAVPVSSFAGESAAPGLTPRQAEIVKELESFRPQGYAGPGAWMLDVWDSDAGLEQLTNFPDGPGNAGANFKRLEELFPTEKKLFDQDPSDSKGVAALLDAAEIGRCRLVPDYYPELATTDSAQPDFLVLRLYLDALLRRAMRDEQRGDAAGAERCYRAALLCGRHLTNDKSSAIVYTTGLIYKLRGAQEYEKFLFRAGREAQVAAAKAYIERVGLLLRALMWKSNVALNEMAGFASLPATIKVATEDREAFWRKEAVSRLAILRHGVPEREGRVIVHNPVFEGMAEEALAQAASRDPDPSVRRMAVWMTLNVKPEEYDKLEHTFR